MKKNWQTNMGGAFSVTGKTLMGVGVLGNINSNTHSALLWYIALAGFIFSAVGDGLTSLFAADAATVNDLTNRVSTIENNTTTIIKP